MVAPVLFFAEFKKTSANRKESGVDNARGVCYNHGMDIETDVNDNNVAAPNGDNNAADSADCAATLDRDAIKPRKKRLVSSVTKRTMLNYIVFSIILIALLWTVFFIGLYIFYDSMLKRDIEEVGHTASAAFPKRADDNSMMRFYKLRLAEIARSNSVAVAVFKRDEAGNDEVLIMIDNLGNGSDRENDVFDAVMSKIHFDCVFSKKGDSEKTNTSLGTYLCYGSRHEVGVGDDSVTMYVLLMKRYEVLNTQTNKILYMLIICTLIVLLLTCIFSYFASRFQTKQLIDFASRAKRLADGDYNVRFSGNGYDEFESLACALNDAKDKVQKSEGLLRDIVANVSHDIRTPLTMIRAYAEMLRDMPVDGEKRKKTADVIISEAGRLTALTDDVLNYSRLQSGVAQFKFEQCDVAHIAQSVLMQFDIFKERDGIVFDIDIDKNAVVNCDRSRIEQVLYNLLGNAINYCGEDKTVILRVKNADNAVRVEVVDHGKGIESQDIDTVWDRYYRTAHAQRTAVGSGLGLSICKNILIEHNAEYGVLSEVGEGATFWFELPACKKHGGGAKSADK